MNVKTAERKYRNLGWEPHIAGGARRVGPHTADYMQTVGIPPGITARTFKDELMVPHDRLPGALLMRAFIPESSPVAPGDTERMIGYAVQRLMYESSPWIKNPATGIYEPGATSMIPLECFPSYGALMTLNEQLGTPPETFTQIVDLSERAMTVGYVANNGSPVFNVSIIPA